MRRVRSFLPAFALVLAVAGCGDGGSDSDNDESGDSPDSATTSDSSSATTEATEDEPTTDTGDDTGGDLGAGCDYLSDADVADATGITGAGVDASQATVANCSWSDETTGSSMNISITQGTETYDLTVQGAEAAIAPSEDLSGVGDEAVILYGDEIVPQGAVVAVAGDKVVTLIYTAATGEEAAVRAAVTELAGKVVANL